MNHVEYVTRGFIDPRRGDTIRIIFPIDPEEEEFIKTQGKSWFYIPSENAPKLNKSLEAISERFKFPSREAYYIVCGRKFLIHSCCGPAPPYPIPLGDLIDITLNINDL